MPPSLPGSGRPDAGDATTHVRRLPRATVAAGVVVGVFAVSTAAILVRLADAPALSLAFWRCGLGALALAPFAWQARHAHAQLTPSQWRQLVAAGGFLALHFALWIGSLSYTTVASSAVLVAMSPLFVGAGAALFLREAPTRRTWTGVALATTGAVVIGAADLLGADVGRTALLGDAMAFAAAAAVSGYLLIGRSLRQKLPVAFYAGSVYATAALVLLPVCAVTGSSLGVGRDGYSVGTWAAILGLVAGPQLLGHTVFNTLLSTVTATVVAVAVLAEPIGSGVLAFLLLDELPQPLFWAGAPFVLAGIWLAATGSRTAGDAERRADPASCGR